MVSLFIDYQRAVVYEYRRRKAVLSLNLDIPTPARLKEQCIRVCTERFLLSDEKVIRDFFGAGSGRKACLSAIELCKPERFKPLINFLNGETARTDEKNIELLAWLIDFPRRPFNSDIDYNSIPEVKAGNLPEDMDQVSGVDMPGFNTTVIEPFHGSVEGANPQVKTEIGEAADVDRDALDEPRKPLGSSESGRTEKNGNAAIAGSSTDTRGKRLVAPIKIYVVGVLFFVVGGGAYYMKDWLIPPPPPSDGSCMYWNKDHYEVVPCDQEMSDVLVLALDTAKLRNFRMLTSKDSVIHRGKGLVWYSKINNDVQFYTADGRHPVHYSRRLKPATQYIIDKYAGLVKPPAP